MRALSSSKTSIGRGEYDEVFGQAVVAVVSFRPQYTPNFRVRGGWAYVVEGIFRAEPALDAAYKVPNPVLFWPSARPGAEWARNDRILLRTMRGEDVFISPQELESNFYCKRQALGTVEAGLFRLSADKTYPNPDMPGDCVPLGALESDATASDAYANSLEPTRIERLHRIL